MENSSAHYFYYFPPLFCVSSTSTSLFLLPALPHGVRPAKSSMMSSSNLPHRSWRGSTSAILCARSSKFSVAPSAAESGWFCRSSFFYALVEASPPPPPLPQKIRAPHCRPDQTHSQPPSRCPSCHASPAWSPRCPSHDVVGAMTVSYFSSSPPSAVARGAPPPPHRHHIPAPRQRLLLREKFPHHHHPHLLHRPCRHRRRCHAFWRSPSHFAVVAFSRVVLEVPNHPHFQACQQRIPPPPLRHYPRQHCHRRHRQSHGRRSSLKGHVCCLKPRQLHGSPSFSFSSSSQQQHPPDHQHRLPRHWYCLQVCCFLRDASPAGWPNALGGFLPPLSSF
ncbi:hypothetical protein TCDM_06422 [Trypanosoma cruzi Dm28c]|uniref:Uncharacterized protein n=1 Tax=Trypanosoma cruzi Dm28c TaxID=1416333 RepID=V5BGS8_TRYCR|nr:hypothetical protein TCDM_06422 [Trypanosoma cruzi Dm28c]